MIAIVVSRADSASEHIGERLLEAGEWTRHEDGDRPDGEGGGTYYRTDGFELRTFDELHVDMVDPAAAFGGAGDAGQAVDAGEAGNAGEAGDAGEAAAETDDATVATGGEGDGNAAGPPDLVVFVSRHSGDTGPLLTAHVTGNFGPAEYGGDPRTLALAAPGTEKRVVDALATHAPEEYDVGIECTHHGPTGVSVPSLFVELGSDEPQWSDPAGARAVARAVLDLHGTGPDHRADDGRPRHLVGFGGGHYAPRFTRIVRGTDWAVGHIGADWALGEMGVPDANREVVAAAFERSRAAHAVIEGDRPELAETVADLGYRVVSETWVRAVDDRPLALVEHLESAMAPVSEGLRFGSVLPGGLGDDDAGGDDAGDDDAGGTDVGDDDAGDDDAGNDAVTIRQSPAALLARAQGIDGDAARAAVKANAVAFETEQSGTRAAGAVAFAADDASPGYADLVADLAAALEAGYDEVVVTDDAVIARETAFDPELAAERGVPEGPAFGRLAAGEAVDVGGETVRPDAVTRSREDRFPIETGDGDRTGSDGTGPDGVDPGE